MAGKLVGDRSLADSECLSTCMAIGRAYPIILACDLRHHGTFIDSDLRKPLVATTREACHYAVQFERQ